MLDDILQTEAEEWADDAIMDDRSYCRGDHLATRDSQEILADLTKTRFLALKAMAIMEWYIANPVHPENMRSACEAFLKEAKK